MKMTTTDFKQIRRELVAFGTRQNLARLSPDERRAYDAARAASGNLNRWLNNCLEDGLACSDQNGNVLETPARIMREIESLTARLRHAARRGE